ncbi:MAG TPA: Gldg family protein [Aggregatilineales bacterium]|nr:Gldg family protein [Anaerolineales bacterium]HRE47282.1 Gldg family protein [Aggregatilineales bacterium]
MKQALAIARKELDSYFGSPMALIFIGVFLLVTHYTFFWVGGFFSRGIADVRPLFQAMPVLLIFLIAALTMRQWSEEQQTGTLDMLLTMPIKLSALVVGKFLAVMALVAVALALTLTIPLTTASLGNLDWGPVIGGYLAAMLLAAAYAAVGLFLSSQTDNQIVALILTVIVGGAFYLIGSPTLTGLVSTGTAEALRAIGTGSRFESIERGVIDARDVIYYLSLTALFLILNSLSLDSKRWSKGAALRSYRENRRVGVVLIAVNLILFNVVMFRAGAVRADLTQNGEYTLSSVTREVLGNLSEPLLLRGYFSQRNHPLLSPLIPRIRDMMKEYESASGGRVRVEFLDPISNPDLEAEANQTYGIRPTPLQVQERGGTSLVNAYFDILLRYGDQNVTLNLLDMIEVNEVGGALDVRLRNLEYDLTSSIQRVAYGFQNIDAVLASLSAPAELTVYVTPDTLPESLKAAPETIQAVAESLKTRAGKNFTYRVVNMSAPDAGVTPRQLFDQYQIQPVAADFLATQTFYLHMVLKVGDKTQVIFPSGGFSENETRTSVESALKRLAPGFLKVIGVWTPPDPAANPFGGGGGQQLQVFQQSLAALGKNYEIRQVDLISGQVPNDVNALFIFAPQALTDMDRYAVDQFLMRGGSIFIAGGNYQITTTQQGGIGLVKVNSGLQTMLAEYGITLEPTLVLDSQNAPFPVPVTRNVGGIAVQEIQALAYPHFVDVRPDAMDRDNPALRNLPSVTINWGSPITLDPEKNAGRTVVTLFTSSAESWTTSDSNTQPDFQFYPETGFPIGATQGKQILAVSVTGTFTSYFKGKPSPFTESTDPTNPAATPPAAPVGLIEQSPANARIVVIGSAETFNDNVLSLQNRLGDNRAANNIQLVQNLADWFVEDTALSSIRARGSASRLLRPLAEGEQGRWEGFNYLFAVVALVGLGFLWQVRRRTEKPMPLPGIPERAAAPPPTPEPPAENAQTEGEN